WIRHLVLITLAPSGIAPFTRWVLQDRVLRFVPLPDARAILEKLMALYWTGLQRPLRLFPQSAQAYIDKDASIDAARRAWLYSDHKYGEGADPYYRLAFRGCDPLDDEFEGLAAAVFGPMKAAMEEERPA
ncbi:MAG TPA: exodeoxyribonuclease V subunit gamma, partial [Burkholderiales bacterium]|nr:exodeoxyribonuclease V subunit gamma [Burkholderiales bacterium]